MARRKSHAFDPEKVGRYRYMVVNLQETFVKVYLFNKAVLSMIFQFFFSDSSHHVGLSLSSFTDLLCILSYHPTRYTVESPSRLHSLCIP